MKKLIAFDVFCGAGGMSFGFEESGIEVRLGLDSNADSINTFAANHKSAVTVCCDIEEVSGEDLLRKARRKTLDVLIGCPSCQGYSTIGKRIEDDPRNHLYVHYLRIVKELNPKWIVFENVRGMAITGKGRFFRELVMRLNEMGYEVATTLLNAADYGIPQRRERVFLMGNRLGIDPSFPVATHVDPRCPACSKPDKSNRIRSLISPENCTYCKGTGFEPKRNLRLAPWVSLKEAIGDLPYLEDLGGTAEWMPYVNPSQCAYQRQMRRWSKGYDLHEAKPLSAYAHSIVKRIPPGMGIRSIPEDELPERFREMRKIGNGNYRRDCTTLYHRLAWNMPSYTITCFFGNVSSGAFTHPEGNRSLTIREGARLQSFPDRFKFLGAGIRRQIGNAVPPILARKIAEHIAAQSAGKNVLEARIREPVKGLSKKYKQLDCIRKSTQIPWASFRGKSLLPSWLQSRHTILTMKHKVVLLGDLSKQRPISVDIDESTKMFFTEQSIFIRKLGKRWNKQAAKNET
jgi:DNA (cytosine-5)-methyltransferase 1